MKRKDVVGYVKFVKQVNPKGSLLLTTKNKQVLRMKLEFIQLGFMSMCYIDKPKIKYSHIVRLGNYYK